MIGFFDSGLGGLTILREVIKSIPGQFLYLGDNARAPYGSRSQEEVQAFTTQGVKWLIDQGCSLVVLACNTASANALRTIQQDWLPQHAPRARVLGILVPTIEVITGMDWQHEETSNHVESILVFATPSTVASGAYEREIKKRLPNALVVSQACPDLASMIEEGSEPTLIEQKIQQYIQEGKEKMGSKPEAVLLGCTHYALVESVFRKNLDVQTRIFSQPQIVTRSLLEYLSRHPLEGAGAPSSVTCFTTADPDQVATVSKRFSDLPIRYTQVDIDKNG
ncbi:glutamate racemase [Patescibacteria group bacterium]|nr:glutamate racemase [Patescibacteria group bacterium]MBP9709671.1 glutamate racemase [Patescibacteria group bacterium]